MLVVAFFPISKACSRVTNPSVAEVTVCLQGRKRQETGKVGSSKSKTAAGQ